MQDIRLKCACMLVDQAFPQSSSVFAWNYLLSIAYMYACRVTHYYSRHFHVSLLVIAWVIWLAI